MKREKISFIYADAQSYADQEITVCGWVRTVRDMKNFGFIELNDGSCFKSLQVVFARETLSNYDEIAKQNVGAALIVKGQLVLTPEAKQPFELKASEITVEGVSTPDYPLQKKRHSVEFLRTIQHLRPRTNLFSAVFRVRSVAAQAIHEFFRDRGFVYVHTPIITGSDAEGAGEMFRVTTLDLNNLPLKEDGTVDDSKDFFGKATNLTVSGQLQAEAFALDLAPYGIRVNNVAPGAVRVRSDEELLSIKQGRTTDYFWNKEFLKNPDLVKDNDFWDLRVRQRTEEGYFELAEQLEDRLKTGTFSRETKDQFMHILEYYGQAPYIVRSSSILEDGFDNAFAGKYESVFCANRGTPEERLEEFENAVRTVYASSAGLSALDAGFGIGLRNVLYALRRGCWLFLQPL